MITVAFNPDDWVWLCEFLSTVLHEGGLDPYGAEDTARILNILETAEAGQ